jgi:hypothetical protein
MELDLEKFGQPVDRKCGQEEESSHHILCLIIVG